MAEGVVELTEDGFEVVSHGLWLVDFWATWCGPCRAMDPVIAELASETANARFGKVEITRQPELATRFGVASVPTMIVFRDGVALKTLHGAKTKRQLGRAVEEARLID